jgi:biopolymer transport protein TolQ
MHDILRLILHTGPVAKAVLFILCILSILSWAVILQKVVLFTRITRVSRKYLEVYRKRKGWSEFYQSSRSYLQSPFARVFIKGFQEYIHIKKQISGEEANPGPGSDRPVTVTQAMESAIQEEMEKLDLYLPFLATTVSISPFLGLFGTVWGVMEAFIRIGMQGSSDIGTVGPGIAEALITTIVGLFVAIPALAAYNLLIAQLRRLENRLSLFASDFILTVERKQIS